MTTRAVSRLQVIQAAARACGRLSPKFSSSHSHRVGAGRWFFGIGRPSRRGTGQVGQDYGHALSLRPGPQSGEGSSLPIGFTGWSPTTNEFMIIEDISNPESGGHLSYTQAISTRRLF